MHIKMSNFSKWKKWANRNELNNLQYPGVYSLAITSQNLSNKPFSLIKEIAYFGMTNSSYGIEGRLNQFENTIIGKTGHGGAERFLTKYPNYKTLIKKLYVSINCIECDVKSNTPPELRKMGEIANFEYICFAEYMKEFGCLPKFNDKKKSPKRKNKT